MFVDNYVQNANQLLGSFNSSCVVIDYFQGDSFESLNSKLAEYSDINFDYLCFIFYDDYSGNQTFVNWKRFIGDSEPTEFIKNLVATKGIQTIDFLACNLLKYESWVNYFDTLMSETGTTIRASNDLTGNVFAGGNWVLETTNEDIQELYFNEKVEYWTGLLEHSTGGHAYLAVNNSTKKLEYFHTGLDSWGESGIGKQTSAATVILADNLSSLTIKSTGDWRDSKISLGLSFGAMITSDEKIYTWGYNNVYQLGNNTVRSSNLPIKVLDGVLIGKTFKKIACSDTFTYVLTDDGLVYCWGENVFGQSAGLPLTRTPTLMTGGIFNGTIDDICAGDYAAACITGGKVYAWGRNRNGHIPAMDASQNLLSTTWNNTNTYSTPVELTLITGTPQRLFSGKNGFACLSSTGLFVWGWNSEAGLGNGGIVGQLTKPLLVNISGKTIISWSNGTEHSIFLNSDGTAFGAGRQVSERLGTTLANNTYTTPTNMSLSNVAKITTGGGNSVVITNTGTVTGLGTSNLQFKIAASTFSSTGKTADYSCSNPVSALILATDNTIYGIGQNNYGELGRYGQLNGYEPNRVNLSVITGDSTAGDIVDFALGESISIVRTNTGRIYGAGYDDYGVLGRGTASNPQQPTMLRIGGALLTKYVTKVSLGRLSTGVITSDNKCYMFGLNQDWLMGIANNANNILTPTELTTIPGETFRDVGMLRKTSIWVTNSGKVYSCGVNDLGQLGVGNTINSGLNNFLPQEITYFTTNNIDVQKVFPGEEFCIALSSSGELYGWGQNTSYQLGDNTTTNRLTPFKITTNISGKVFTQVSCAQGTTLALTNQYELYYWGTRYTFNSNDIGEGRVPTKITIFGSNIPTYAYANSATYNIMFANNQVNVTGFNSQGQYGDFTVLPTENKTNYYDVSLNLPGYTMYNYSNLSQNASFVNNSGGRLLDSSLNNALITFPTTQDAINGTLTIDSLPYSSSAFSSLGVGDSSMVCFNLTPDGTTFSTYISMDYAYKFTGDSDVYMYTSGDSSAVILSTSDSSGYGAYYEVIDTSRVRIWTNHFSEIGFDDIPGGGGGAGSDPYVTSLYGNTFELPHTIRWWELFHDHNHDLKIMAHTQNYSFGTFFNEITLQYDKTKISIDYNKKQINKKGSSKNISLGKSNYLFNFKNKSKDDSLFSVNQKYDCILIKHPVFRELKIIINWQYHYIYTDFGKLKLDNCSGLLTKKEFEGKIKSA